MRVAIHRIIRHEVRLLEVEEAVHTGIQRDLPAAPVQTLRRAAPAEVHEGGVQLKAHGRLEGRLIDEVQVQVGKAMEHELVPIEVVRALEIVAVDPAEQEVPAIEGTRDLPPGLQEAVGVAADVREIDHVAVVAHVLDVGLPVEPERQFLVGLPLDRPAVRVKGVVRVHASVHQVIEVRLPVRLRIEDVPVLNPLLEAALGQDVLVERGVLVLADRPVVGKVELEPAAAGIADPGEEEPRLARGLHREDAPGDVRDGRVPHLELPPVHLRVTVHRDVHAVSLDPPARHVPRPAVARGESPLLQPVLLVGKPADLVAVDAELRDLRLEAPVVDHAHQGVDVELHEITVDDVPAVGEPDVAARDPDPGIHVEHHPVRLERAPGLLDEDVSLGRVHVVLGQVIDFLGGNVDGKLGGPKAGRNRLGTGEARVSQ